MSLHKLDIEITDLDGQDAGAWLKRRFAKTYAISQTPAAGQPAVRVVFLTVSRDPARLASDMASIERD